MSTVYAPLSPPNSSPFRLTVLNASFLLCVLVCSSSSHVQVKPHFKSTEWSIKLVSAQRRYAEFLGMLVQSVYFASFPLTTWWILFSG
ncbi:hypothetical protein EGR_09748 [Echinococcus granulosus]|uniref:Uncharacterized protein n=1 Tax=Echinococcus granulosus TaxID=6210 RepID=W6UAA4_ECHGR|nr:hypothetical protein EGR_09748 [Echinococcus granulosus]EUB55402.1 hypothetical protein EGR_09748 [Echinococcus granulosus]